MSDRPVVTHITLEKDDIRQVACPTCRAQVGDDCLHEGKGALKKARNRTNHIDRMKLAQAAYTAGQLSLSEIEVIDEGDIW